MKRLVFAVAALTLVGAACGGGNYGNQDSRINIGPNWFSIVDNGNTFHCYEHPRSTNFWCYEVVQEDPYNP
jgi:hypothetical protein